MKTGCSSRGNWRPLPSQKPWLLMAIAFATVLLLPLLFKFHIQTASGKVPSDAVALNGEIQRPKVSPTTAPPPRLDRPVTVVTAYYNIPSKHSNAEYLKWIGNFLPRIPCYMYLFTDEKSAEQLIKLRAPFLNRTIFVVRPFAQLKEGMLGSIKAQYDCVKAFSETDFTADLKKIDIPVMILHGDADQIVPLADSALLTVGLVKNSFSSNLPWLSAWNVHDTGEPY
ncbi:hypothetical protein BV898_15545 [Hypsibius exemplaris]|uniref:Uncharacterized protein n=1 Tax=Hypsibius exemplaris TaxID=2072580 RepID=A0A9X6ND52_HYPEX|nr:hypothetical protein BV898_15545 [Hypsibius exemplaris]